MTMGKDVSMLFADVINCMQTENMELKKLVYLYLTNYATVEPDLTILAVNTFVKDTQDNNPFIRALAVRTMGCIRVEKITEYLCDPLQLALQDKDPYVRKTAVICVAKMFALNPQLVQDRGFLEQLTNLLSDDNPIVVANAVAVISEIYDHSSDLKFSLTPEIVSKLLQVIKDCTEWGQVFILDSLSEYSSNSEMESIDIIERVLPRLQHVNCAVVMSATKVILKHMEICSEEKLERNYVLSKLTPPLITLLKAEYEIQFIALQTMELILKLNPEFLRKDVKVFFCKYNDPAYLKQKKLRLITQLADEENIKEILPEFLEYCTEVDVEFVRKVVNAIGQCASSVKNSATECVQLLETLIQMKVSYVVQEAIIVIKDVFRQFPNEYEHIISSLCDNLETLDQPEARAAFVWIIGEYAERIDNSSELLETLIESFNDEPLTVQLQLLTASVKLYLKKDFPGHHVQDLLMRSTVETDDPDLRDRAYIYWRILSGDLLLARKVILIKKEVK